MRGLSLHIISRKVNKPHSAVNYIVNKFKYRGTTKNLPRIVKENKLKEQHEWFLLSQVKVNPRLNEHVVRAIAEEVSGKQMSNQTVRRVLWNMVFMDERQEKHHLFL